MPTPPKHLEIQIAWTERKSDRWLPRRMSTEVLIADPCDNLQLPIFVVNGYTEQGDAGPLHMQIIFSGQFRDQLLIADSHILTSIAAAVARPNRQAARYPRG